MKQVIIFVAFCAIDLTWARSLPDNGKKNLLSVGGEKGIENFEDANEIEDQDITEYNENPIDESPLENEGINYDEDDVADISSSEHNADFADEQAVELAGRTEGENGNEGARGDATAEDSGMLFDASFESEDADQDAGVPEEKVKGVESVEDVGEAEDQESTENNENPTDGSLIEDYGNNTNVDDVADISSSEHNADFADEQVAERAGGTEEKNDNKADAKDDDEQVSGEDEKTNDKFVGGENEEYEGTFWTLFNAISSAMNYFANLLSF